MVRFTVQRRKLASGKSLHPSLNPHPSEWYYTV